MDIMMRPIMDGYKAMQEIRAQKLFSSAADYRADRARHARRAGKVHGGGRQQLPDKPIWYIERLLTLLRVWLFRQEMAA